MAPPEMARFRNGLNEVFKPTTDSSNSKTQSVVVFIHGLFGHPWKTWADDASKAKKKPFWPEDLLPDVLNRKTAVYSFGYDADVEKFMGAAGLNTVHQHGANLLHDLRTLTETSKGDISLAFVVHSLGGLVLKEALNQSSTSEKPGLRGVVEATRGIVFLGTPHRGSAVASYGKIAFTLTKIFAAQSANTKLLRALEKSSETLDRITTVFYETTTKHPHVGIFSFYEEKETRRGLIGTRIVPPECAKVGHPREEVQGIPADHRYMAKFTSSSDTGFIRVSNVLNRWIRAHEARVSRLGDLSYLDCLQSLNDPTARARIEEVSRRHKESFEWLFSDRVPFTRWLADDERRFSPLFWITGKPGSGKSTLMRFAMGDPRLLEHMPDGEGKPVGYFFHLRGKSVVQKSLAGMLQELLYQLLLQFPDGFNSVRSIFQTLVSSQRAPRPTWSVWVLQDVVLGLVSHLCQPREGCRRRCVLFIDALDENEDQAENMQVLSIVRELASKVVRASLGSGSRPSSVLKICLASRPWPIFQKHLGESSHILSFAIHDFTRSDIASYCRSLLEDAVGSAEGRSTTAEPGVLDEMAGRFSKQITDKARGVFIWVRIVLEELCQNIIDGTPPQQLEALISSLPDELQDLYEHTMKRIRPEYAPECIAACRIVLDSAHQLSLAELRTATLAAISAVEQGPRKTFRHKFGGGRTAGEERVPATQTDSREESDTPELTAWLRSRTGGLVDVVGPAVANTRTGSRGEDTADTQICTTQLEPAAEDLKVQLIHQTAHEFLRKGIRGLQTNCVSRKLGAATGHALICGAITSKWPHPHGLRKLASFLIYHLQQEDAAWANRSGEERAPDASRSTFPFSHTGPDHFSPFRLEQGSPVGFHLMPKDMALEYSTFIDGLRSLPFLGLVEGKDPGSVMAVMSQIVSGLDRWIPYMYPATPRHVNLVLFIAALGPSWALEPDRPRAVVNVLRELLLRSSHPNSRMESELRDFYSMISFREKDSSPFMAGSSTNILVRAVGRIYPIVHAAPLGDVLVRLFLLEHHDWVDEDTRFEIAKAILESHCSTWKNAFETGIWLKNDISMTLLSFTARFKSRRWLDLLLRHGNMILEDGSVKLESVFGNTRSGIPLASGHEPCNLIEEALMLPMSANARRSTSEGNFLLEYGDEINSRRTMHQALALAGVVGMGPAFPRVGTYCYLKDDRPRSEREMKVRTWITVSLGSGRRRFGWDAWSLDTEDSEDPGTAGQPVSGW